MRKEIKQHWTANLRKHVVLIFLAGFILMSCEKDFDVPQERWAAALADPRTTIDLSQFAPGMGTVTAQPWDIGTGINAYAWHAPNARAVVLLQHGYGEFAFLFVSLHNNLIGRLLSQGISVYALDARGHGYTKGERGVIDVEQAVADHLVARVLLKKQPLPVYLFGFSLGGLITASSMARTQEGLSGAVLMGSALYYSENNPFSRFLTQSYASFAPRSAMFGRGEEDYELVYRGASTDPAFMGDPLIYKGDIPVKTLATTLKLAKQNPKYYPRITVPLLLLHGTEDEATEYEGSQRMYDAVSSPDKTLHLVEGGRHYLLNDEKKAESLTLILNWYKARVR